MEYNACPLLLLTLTGEITIFDVDRLNRLYQLAEYINKTGGTTDQLAELTRLLDSIPDSGCCDTNAAWAKMVKAMPFLQPS